MRDIMSCLKGYMYSLVFVQLIVKITDGMKMHRYINLFASLIKVIITCDIIFEIARKIDELL